VAPHAYRFVLHDRDSIYSPWLDVAITAMGVRVLRTPVQAPQTNAYTERMIASIRRECLAQVMVFSTGHLRRLRTSYLRSYHRWRTHLSLARDCPDTRPVQPPEQGAVVAFPEVGGFHRHYERMAA
jgi:putative transposase